MVHGDIPRKEPILMEKRKWTSQQKLQIVLEGLSGQIDISKLCAKYQVSQAQYYKWRDQLLKRGNQAFEIKDVTKKEQHLKRAKSQSVIARIWGYRRVWLYLTVVLDWYTKEIIGYSLGLQSKTEDWLKAIYQAVNSRFPKGIQETEKEQLFFDLRQRLPAYIPALHDELRSNGNQADIHHLVESQRQLGYRARYTHHQRRYRLVLRLG